MKASMLPRGRSAAAFTLTEVLIVITIIGALFALVMGAFTYAQNASKRNTTTITLNAMKSALESYRKDIGEYPEPGNPGQTVEVVGKTYDVSGAAMLYQALSGDGNDNIQISTDETVRISNGSLDDEEVKLVFLKDMPKTMWSNKDDIYHIVDGWGRPFQYTRAVDIDPTNTTPTAPETINQNSYDLWSYGQDVDNTTKRSIDIQTDTELKRASAQWITNW